jgi:hypothetical protein
MTLNIPDYQGGSIANLMSSIIAARGGETELYPPLRGLEMGLLNNARNVVLLIIDGLGYHYLTRQGAGGTMAQHLHGCIHAVAPPTTAASVTTYLTGLAPQQHGLTGWYTWMRELGSVVTVLPFITRCNRADLTHTGITPEALLGHRPVFDRMKTDCYSLMPDWLSESAFNRAHLGKAQLVLHENLEHCFAQIAQTVLSHDGRKYVYAYWPGFDALSHEHGVGSVSTAQHFARIDALFENLVKELRRTDSVLLLSADHGFIDAPAEHRLQVNDLPSLQQCLQLPLCGEPRLAYCYVRSDMRQAFVDYVRNELSHVADLYSGQALIEQGLFGLGEPHPELAARVGDYALVMKEDYVLTQQLPGEPPPDMVGFHGGLSREEMDVPLLMVQC